MQTGRPRRCARADDLFTAPSTTSYHHLGLHLSRARQLAACRARDSPFDARAPLDIGERLQQLPGDVVRTLPEQRSPSTFARQRKAHHAPTACKKRPSEKSVGIDDARQQGTCEGMGASCHYRSGGGWRIPPCRRARGWPTPQRGLLSKVTPQTCSRRQSKASSTNRVRWSAPAARRGARRRCGFARRASAPCGEPISNLRTAPQLGAQTLRRRRRVREQQCFVIATTRGTGETGLYVHRRQPVPLRPVPRARPRQRAGVRRAPSTAAPAATKGGTAKRGDDAVAMPPVRDAVPRATRITTLQRAGRSLHHRRRPSKACA